MINYQKIDWNNNAAPPNIDQFNAWIVDRSLVCPADYMNFIRTVNGGIPNRRSLRISDGKSTRIEFFHGFYDEGNQYGIQVSYDASVEKCSDFQRLLPVAEDSGANIFFLVADCSEYQFSIFRLNVHNLISEEWSTSGLQYWCKSFKR